MSNSGIFRFCRWDGANGKGRYSILKKAIGWMCCGCAIFFFILKLGASFGNGLMKTFFNNFASTPQPPPKTSHINVLPGVIDDLNRLITTQYRRHEVLPYVVADLGARADFGFKKYGTLLQAYNGRDALYDAYQEALDAIMYLGQARMERGITLPEHIYQRAIDLAVDLRKLILERDD